MNIFNEQCPCGSKKIYKKCCEKFHEGKIPKSALELMRSRYSAYALKLVDYIIKTTHPDHPSIKKQTEEAFKNELIDFVNNTNFESLEVLDSTEQGNQATVTFIVHLSSNGKNISFKEKSYFEKVNGKWLYKSGDFYALE